MSQPNQKVPKPEAQIPIELKIPIKLKIPSNWLQHQQHFWISAEATKQSALHFMGRATSQIGNNVISKRIHNYTQGCIFRLTCSHPELTKDHVLTSANMLKFLEPSREMPKCLSILTTPLNNFDKSNDLNKNQQEHGMTE